MGQSRHKRGDRGRDLGTGGGWLRARWGKAPRSKTALEEKTLLCHWSSSTITLCKDMLHYQVQRIPHSL